MNKKVSLIIILLLSLLTVSANQIDIGIFESQTVPDQIEVKMRPDFDIQADETVTGILYTIRWNEPSVTITTQYIYPFFISPQGSPVEHNGYYYQVFAAVPLIATPMNANEEYVISTFTYTNGNCVNFEIIEDDWTQANNGNVYFEFLGVEVTGIIYEPWLSFGGQGGSISGPDTIFLGNSTGSMILSGYNGTILSWQRKTNDNDWTDIPGTAGLTSYSDTPLYMGNHSYRVKIQHGTCPEVYSDSLSILVVSNIELNLKVFFEGSFFNGEMMTSLNEQDLIPLYQPYFGSPWNYNGTESVVSMPSTDVVDWILIELRETDGDASTASSDKSIFRKAGFLLKSGQIKTIDGVQNMNFVAAITKNVYAIIWHRNHLPVISNYPMNAIMTTYFYDFTSGELQAYEGSDGHKELAPGKWGMYAGDGDANGTIETYDKTFSWGSQAGLNGYFSGDFDMNGQLMNQDKNELWYENNGQETQVPD